MPNLETLLQDTAFFKMHPQRVEHSIGERASDSSETWRWSLDTSAAPVVSALQCRNDAGEWACVLDRLEWEAPAVDTDFATGLKLPLDAQYALKMFRARDGVFSGNPDYLDDISETGFLVVYGYQYSPAERAVKPLLPKQGARESDASSHEAFFADYWEDYPPFEKRKVGEHAKLRVFVRPIKFLFAMELICCSANNRFEPTGAGRVARFYPRSYLIGNASFLLRNATTRLLRPMHAQHSGHDHDGLPAEECDGAGHDYRNGLYADANASPLVHGPLPKWPSFFSYYSFDDRREHHAVKREARHERVDASSQKILMNKAYANGTVVKLPRQGAFDNVHIAPAMIAPEVIRRKRQSGPAAKHWASLDSILMAPVCHHDCFHMHWRWGAGYSDTKHLRGWTEEGAYRAMGAPMIPPNQDLYVRCPSANEVHYRVAVREDIPAMRWQVFFDHGAGYMVGLEKEFAYFDFQRLGVEVVLRTTALGTSDVEPIANNRSWAMFYWNMRYANPISLGLAPSAPLERILLSETALQTLIDL